MRRREVMETLLKPSRWSVFLAAALGALGPPSLEAGAGTASGLLLEEAFGGRPNALGQAYVALADDVFGLPFNPAGLSQMDKAQVATQYSSALLDQRLGFFGLAMPVTRAQSLGLSFSFLDGGNFDVFDEFGNKTRSVSAQSAQLLNLGYGLAWTDLPFSLPGALHTGVGAKYLRSVLLQEVKAQALAFDGGLLYVRRVRSSGTASAALAVSNIGQGLRYSGGKATGEVRDPLPRIYRAGASYQRSLFRGDSVTASAELDRQAEDKSNVAAVGVEYLHRGLVAVRVGYRSGEDLGPLTFGMGLLWKDLSLDYSMSLLEVFGPQHKVSLAYSFSIPWVEPKVRLSGDVLAYRIESEIAEGRYFHAMESALRLCELSPEDPIGPQQKANIQARVASLAKAETVGKRYYYASGHRAFYQKQWDKAAEWLSEAVKRDPEDAESRKFLNLARKKNEEAAEYERLKAAARVSYLYELADRAHLAREHEKALSILSEILRISRYAPAVKLEAVVREDQKRRPAGSLARQAHPMEEKVKQLFFQAIRSYSDGNLPEAIRILKAAQELSPQNRDISGTLDRVQQEYEALLKESQRRNIR